MKPTHIITNDRLSAAICLDTLVPLPGQIPDRAEDTHGQIHKVLAKIDALLAEAGLRKERILGAIIYLGGIAHDFAAPNEVRTQWLPTGQASSRATVQAELTYSSVLAEITVVAARGRLTFHSHKKKEAEPPMETLISSILALSLPLVIDVTQAEELSGAPRKVADNGTITLGHRDTSVPFSYLGNDSGQPMGHSVGPAGRVAERLKSTPGKPELKVEYNLVTSQTRIPLVQNGTVDLECSFTKVTAEWQKQVAFSYGFIYVRGQLPIRKDSGIAHSDDPKDKNVVTIAGTTSEHYLKSYNTEHKLGTSVVNAKDHGEAFQMLQSGRAMAFYMDDALFCGERAKARRPHDWVVVGESRSQEIYGRMARRDNPQLLALVSETLAGLYRSGEIQRIYQHWFQQPIPPKGLSLEFPMTTELKAILENPTSDPMQ